MRSGLLCGFVLPLALASTAVLAQPAPRPAPPAAGQPAVDPAYEAALKAFDALPENDRRAIQDALMWTGDYNGVVGVNFGKRAYDGIRAFQKRRNAPQTGILTDQQWALLTADAKRARDSVRFATLEDAKTKIRIGVPMRVTEKRSPIDGSGFVATSYRSNDSVLALELAAWPLRARTLEQAFAEETGVKPGRKVTYKFQRPDFFVVSGEDGASTYYTRAAKNDSEMRMFTFSYPKARKADFDRVMLAIANSFDPFPTTTVAAANSQQQSGPAATPTPPRPVFAATGLVIAPGRVLTSAQVTKACANPIVNGSPARAEGDDRGTGAIVLIIAGGRPAQVSTTGAAPVDNDSVVALTAASGQPTQVASGAVRAGGGTPLLVAGLAGGAMGAPAFDRKGRLIGVVVDNPRPVAIASLGATPALNHKIAPASQMGLPAGNAGEDLSAGAIAQRFAPSIVSIGCAS